MGNPLSLKQTEEAFTGRVITAMTDCTHTTAVLVDLTNTLHQTRIRAGTRAWRAILPSVITAGGHFQTSAHQSHRVVIAAALDHRVPLDDSLAKYAAASLKKSRSLVTWANSRLRRASSSSRGLPVPRKAFSASDCASRTQRVSRLGATPISAPGPPAGSSLLNGEPARWLPARTRGCISCAWTRTLLQLSVSLLENVRGNGVDPFYEATVRDALDFKRERSIFRFFSLKEEGLNHEISSIYSFRDSIKLGVVLTPRKEVARSGNGSGKSGARVGAIHKNQPSHAGTAE